MSRSFFVRVCMFTVSNALLMSSATAMVRAGGMNEHVSSITVTCYFELHRLALICRFLKSTATATLVSAFCQELTTATLCC